MQNLDAAKSSQKPQHPGKVCETSALHSDVPNGTPMEDAQRPHDAYDSIPQSIRDIETMLREEFNHGESCESTRGEDDQARIGLIEDEAAEADGAAMSVMQETKIRVAIDSGAVRSVAHPSVMPAGIKITPNVDGKHFSSDSASARRYSPGPTAR